jgi:VWFA-related protein
MGSSSPLPLTKNGDACSYNGMVIASLGQGVLRLFAMSISLVLGFLPPSHAQEPAPNVIHVDVNLVMVDATLKTKSGQIMGGLKKEDFELREDGVPQKIDIFSRDELPLNVALVLDLSDSIGPFLGPLREAANTALGALKSDDEVALFTFSTEAELRVPFTKDKSQLAARQTSMMESLSLRGISSGRRPRAVASSSSLATTSARMPAGKAPATS